MINKFILLFAAMAISACATATPPPQLLGQKVRPLNSSKWDYKAALGEQQQKLNIKKSSNGGVNE